MKSVSLGEHGGLQESERYQLGLYQLCSHILLFLCCKLSHSCCPAPPPPHGLPHFLLPSSSESFCEIPPKPLPACSLCICSTTEQMLAATCLLPHYSTSPRRGQLFSTLTAEETLLYCLVLIRTYFPYVKGFVGIQ